MHSIHLFKKPLKLVITVAIGPGLPVLNTGRQYLKFIMKYCAIAIQSRMISATNVRTPKKKPAKAESYESASPRKRPAARRRAREASESEEDEGEEQYSEEEVKPGRRAGRKASQVTKYSK